MKKIIMILMTCVGLGTVSMAQAPAKKQEDKIKAVPAKPVSRAQVVPMHKHEAKISSVAEKSKPVTTTAPVVLKKDGTADKRYKNSDAAKVPLKKDGTPDKRFRSNKKNR
jgi:colicin import membrane protein